MLVGALHSTGDGGPVSERIRTDDPWVVVGIGAVEVVLPATVVDVVTALDVVGVAAEVVVVAREPES